MVTNAQHLLASRGPAPGTKCGPFVVLGEAFCARGDSGHRRTLCVAHCCQCGAAVVVPERSLARARYGCQRCVGSLRDVWRHMLDRCNVANHQDYPRYGARGIRVCDEWVLDPHAFYRFAVRAGWQRGLVIDRIDPDGNYEPANVRFVTRRDSQRNRRDTPHYEIAGLRRSVHEWASLFGTVADVIMARIRLGWDPVIAVCLPTGHRGRRRHLSDDELADLDEWIANYRRRRDAGFPDDSLS